MAEKDRHDYAELLQQAQDAYRGLRLDDALEYYLAAGEARPDGYEARLGLSRILGRLRRVEEAYVAAQRCIELAPERFEGYASLGTLHWLMARNDEAISLLQRSIELAPKEADPRLTLAQVYTDAVQIDRARAELAAAREFIAAIEDDDLRNRTGAFSWHVETYLLLAEGNDAEAMEAAQEAVDLQDANPYAASLALSNLGILHARARRYVEGIECLERARRMNPFLYQVENALGRLLLVTHSYERAAEVLGEATQNATRGNGSTRHAYATALAKLGRREEAGAQYRQALREGLGGLGGVIARWQLIWLSVWGRYALLGALAVGLLAWALFGEPSPTALTLVALVALILVLQKKFGQAKR